MAIKFGTIKPGDVLYDVRRQRAGNTTMIWSHLPPTHPAWVVDIEPLPEGVRNK